MALGQLFAYFNNHYKYQLEFDPSQPSFSDRRFKEVG